MKQLKAIIFDMDGVVVDSEPHHERAFRAVFEEMGYGDNHGMDFTAYYGRSDEALWRDFIARHCPDQSLPQLLEWKQSRLLKILEEEEPIFAEIPELVEKLAGRYRLAIASGSNHAVIDVVLKMRDLRRFFPVVVSVEDVAHGKPAPDVFLRAAEMLKVAPEAICVIEDAEAGVEAALAAGMTVIGITNSLPAERLARASKVVKTYPEMEGLLLG
jgi:HAD superfamily hydrolase (TIGR01509 family)